MKIFGLNTISQQFVITEDDRLWVEENFRWLKEVFCYPNKMEEQVLLTPQFFPATFAAEQSQSIMSLTTCANCLASHATSSNVKCSPTWGITTTGKPEWSL